MAKSFAEYISNNPKKNKEEQAKTQNTSSHQQNNFQKENIENLVNQFQGKSQDELLKTLHSEVAKQKQNGTFDIKKLESSIEMLSPFLSEQQKKNIKELLKHI